MPPADASLNGNGHVASGSSVPPLWLDCFNRLVGTNLRDDDPANLRAIKRTIARGYTLADCEAVVTWAVSTWPGTVRGNFLRPSTVFGEKFGQYLEDAKHPRRGVGDTGRVNAKWGQPTPTLVVRRDDDSASAVHARRSRVPRP